MEVRPGYKQTEVGVIPEEWEVTCLGVHGATYGGLKGKTKKDFGAGEAKYVTFMNVMSNVVIDCDTFESVIVGATESQNRVVKHDLIFNGSSETPEEVALCAVQLGDVVNLFINSFCFGYRLRDTTDTDALFLAYLFRSGTGREIVRASAQGSTRYNISKGALLCAPIPRPPLPEQRAIATALSDVDALLGGLDRLIAKKRDIKQAAMQQLLTGQTRLPGFDGEWEVKCLGELAEMGSGGTPLSSVPAYYDGDIPWVSIADMTRAGKVIEMVEKTLTPLGLANSAAQMFPAGTVLYAMYASLGECSIAGVPVCTSQAILGIRPKVQLRNEFLYYFLVSIKATVKNLGQHGTQSNLNKGMVQGFGVALPSCEEQTAIANILSDMDAELAAFEARHAKTRALKQAMMQELLTGKTRLIPPGAAPA